MPIDEARRALAGRYLMALTGAGMSVESGIPPFRGPGGLWNELDPERDASVMALESEPERVWHVFRRLGQPVLRARPHHGHQALARAERSGRLLGVATTNVDGLHQQAGSRRVIELHGNAREMVCHGCDEPVPRHWQPPPSGVPRCACGGVLRPRVTLFGELLPAGTWEQTMQLLEEAEGLIAVGTSLMVQPAAAIPTLIRRRGLPVVEIGPRPSEMGRRGDSYWVGGTARTVLPELLGRSLLRRLFRGG
jgi:NAD-dependent deacetylase